MSTFRVNHQQYPGAMPPEPSIGQSITLTLTGTIVTIEDDVVDVTEMGGKPSFIPASRHTTILVTELRP